MISSVPNSAWQPSSLAPHCSAAELSVQGQAQGLMGKEEEEENEEENEEGGSQQGVFPKLPLPIRTAAGNPVTCC